MRKMVFSLLIAAVFVVAHATAYASTLTATELLGGFNAIIFNDASTSSDIEGAAIIGGDFTGATVYNHPNGVVIPDLFSALNVYGDLHGTGNNLDNGGNAYVAGTVQGTLSFNGGHYASTPGDMSVSAMRAELIGFSEYLAALEGNSSLPTPDNNEVIHASPDADGLAVFNISVNDLDLIPSYSIALEGASTVIFNVSGSVLDFNANYQGGDSIFDSIIWNFYEATDLDFQTLIGGTILAPYASVRNGNQIDGTLVADTWTGDGELHAYNFDGDVPLATPEPSTLLLFVCGLACLGLWRRQARRAAAASPRSGRRM